MNARKTVLAACVCVLLVGAVGYTAWHAAHREETPRDIVLGAFNDGIGKIHEHYTHEEGNMTIDVSVPAGSLGAEFPQMLEILRSVVKGVRTDTPDEITVSLSVEYSGSLEGTDTGMRIGLTGNLMDDRLLFDLVLSDDSVFFRPVETPEFAVAEMRELIDARTGVWTREYIGDEISADVANDREYLDMVNRLYGDFIALLVREKVLRLGSADGKDGFHVIEYEVDMERLPEVLAGGEFDEKVLKPFAAMFRDLRDAPFYDGSQEDTIADFMRMRDDIVAYIRANHDDIEFSGALHIETMNRIPAGGTIHITMEIDDEESEYDGTTIRISTRNTLKEGEYTPEKPTEYETDMGEFFEQLLFSATFALLPALGPTGL